MRRLSALLILMGLMALAVQPAAAWSHKKNFWSKTIKGSGDTATVTRELEEFDRIENKTCLDLEIVVGESGDAELTIDDNLVDIITTEVEGGRLVIDFDKSCSSRSRAGMKLFTSDLRFLKIYGSGDADVTGLDRRDFGLEIFGSGDVDLAGAADSFDLEIFGSGDVKAKDLATHSAEVSIKGSGDVVLTADRSVELSVFGSGDIVCYGDPPERSKKTFGSGDIHFR